LRRCSEPLRFCDCLSGEAYVEHGAAERRLADLDRTVMKVNRSPDNREAQPDALLAPTSPVKWLEQPVQALSGKPRATVLDSDHAS